jgi:Spy/CpxP family protein refolding chaperone
MNGSEARGKWRLWSGVVAVFIVGMIIGGLTTTALMRSHISRIMRNGHSKVHESLANRLTEDLALTKEQREQVERITQEFKPRFGQFEQRSRAEVREIATQMEARIREILTPEQQTKFDAGLKKMQEDMRKRDDMRNRRAPWPGGEPRPEGEPRPGWEPGPDSGSEEHGV